MKITFVVRSLKSFSAIRLRNFATSKISDCLCKIKPQKLSIRVAKIFETELHAIADVFAAVLVLFAIKSTLYCDDRKFDEILFYLRDLPQRYGKYH